MIVHASPFIKSKDHHGVFPRRSIHHGIDQLARLLHAVLKIVGRSWFLIRVRLFQEDDSRQLARLRVSYELGKRRVEDDVSWAAACNRPSRNFNQLCVRGTTGISVPYPSHS